MMKTRFLLIPFLLACTGCATPFPSQPTSKQGFMRVNTIPQGAVLQFPDGTDCITPCRVLVPQPLPMIIAKAGYQAINTSLTRNRKGQITYKMELSAPTTDVESTTLPDL